MLQTICGWYSLVLTVLSIIITIAVDGEQTIEHTGPKKLIKVIINLPILYFVITSLFN